MKSSTNNHKKTYRLIGLFTVIIFFIIVISALLFIDPIVNYFFKDDLKSAFKKNFPSMNIEFGDLHINILGNTLKSDYLDIISDDSATVIKSTDFSMRGIKWFKLLKDKINQEVIDESKIDLHDVKLRFYNDHQLINLGEININIPEKHLLLDSIQIHPLISDEKLFALSKYRQTRFRFKISRIEITNTNLLELTKGSYTAGSIHIKKPSMNVLIDKDKPYDSSAKPKMLNEVFSEIKQKVKIDSIIITDGHLDYFERWSLSRDLAHITMSNLDIAIRNIENKKRKNDTTLVNVDGLFMDSRLKLKMFIPLNSKEFGLRYSGSMGKMNALILNQFLEVADNNKVKSGEMESADFRVTVNNGQADGVLNVQYKDLSVVKLNEKTGSDKGIINKITSFIGKLLVIKGDNIPGEKQKTGNIHYIRKPGDSFIQVIWFALRSGLSDVVGF